MIFEPVTTDNQQRAIEILADAFHDDPVINWSFNQPASLVPFFEFTLPVFVPHGHSYMDPEGRGAAAWLGPQETLKWPKSPRQAMRILRLGGLGGIYRMMLSGYHTERHHPQMPHYYLFAIGVTPANKGLGLGSALISHVLRTCDDENMPAYLENSKEENLRFYEGHGFTVQKEIRFAKSAPPLWLMWREPGGGRR